MTLSRTTDHGPPTEHPETGWQVCESCHSPYRWSSETGDYSEPPGGPCSGLKRGSLERTKGVAPVSDRKDEKRQSSVTQETLEMIPEVVEWIKSRDCFLSEFDWVEHECEVYGGRSRIEVAHLKPRGKGYGDYVVVGGDVMLSAVSACPKAHDQLDGQREHPDLDRAEIQEMAALWVAQYQDEAPEPPEHYRMKASGELVD